jgi:hypothetical protein
LGYFAPQKQDVIDSTILLVFNFAVFAATEPDMQISLIRLSDKGFLTRVPQCRRSGSKGARTECGIVKLLQANGKFTADGEEVLLPIDSKFRVKITSTYRKRLRLAMQS